MEWIEKAKDFFRVHTDYSTNYRPPNYTTIPHFTSELKGVWRGRKGQEMERKERKKYVFSSFSSH